MSKDYKKKSTSGSRRNSQDDMGMDLDREVSPRELKRLSQKIQKQKKKLLLRKIGFGMAAVQIISVIVLIVLLFMLNVVPTKYMVIFIILMLLISAYNVLSQYSKSHAIGKGISVLLSIVAIIGSVFAGQALAAMGNVSGADKKVDVIQVVVLASDSAQSIEDAKTYTFGHHSTLDKSNTDKMIEKLNSKLGSTIKTNTYSDMIEMINALYNKKIGAVILNESYVQTLEDTFPDFEKQTRVLTSETFETKIEANRTKDISKDTFTIYLSGNDSFGSLSSSGRSDVNIVITVNPKTRQILLVNTPRDYYVSVNSLTSGIGMDKLTHAGNFGVDASMQTLKDLYGIDINYYVKLNFSGTVDIVNALGGITVNSELAFTTTPDTAPVPYHFTVGPNKIGGDETLAFCRERQAFGDGDNQRGRNQMLVVSAIIDKVTSPSILSSYSSLLESVSSLFETSLSQSEIGNLVKLMLNDPSGWNIQTYNAKGKGIAGDSYFYGYKGLSVIEPDMNTVNTAISLMGKIKNGETFNVEELE